MPRARAHYPVFIVLLLAAVALHAWESFVQIAGRPSFGWFAWGLLPYSLCVVTFVVSKNGIPATAGAAVALALDIAAHYEVFVHPAGSTSPLALIFVPLWNSLLFSPGAMLLAWFLSKRSQRQKNAF